MLEHSSISEQLKTAKEQLKEHRKALKAATPGTAEYDQLFITTTILREDVEELQDELKEARRARAKGGLLACSQTLEEQARGMGFRSVDTHHIKDESTYLLLSLIAHTVITDPQDKELVHRIDAMRMRAQIDSGVMEWPDYHRHLKPVVPSQQAAGNPA